VFYGGSAAEPGHVAIYVGNGQVIGIGSDNGVVQLDMNYRSDIVGYRTYVPNA
jgi:cell wall-associated NlpC family hydrolase